jgi:protein TonB
MSPPAAGMAVLLHVTVALALWLISPLKFTESAPPPPIEVTIEKPPETTTPATAATPPPPPPSAPAAAAPAAQPPPAPPAARSPTAPTTSSTPLGMPPPEPKTADKPTPAPTKPDEPKEATPLPKPSELQEATAAPPKPEPDKVEKELPPVAPPPAPLSMQDFVKIAPPPAPHEVARTMPPPAPRPAPTPTPNQQLQHSPLSTAPNQHAPQTATAPSNSFVNPAEAAARSRVMDEYTWQVIRKFSQYLPNLRDKNEGGTVTLRFTIARDGRLLDVAIAQSSGVMALDRGMLEAIRAASPYPPLPPEFHGDRATITQPITARR